MRQILELTNLIQYIDWTYRFLNIVLHTHTHIHTRARVHNREGLES